MKRLATLALLVGVLGAPAAFAQQTAAPSPTAGEELFKARCALCHTDAEDAAPTVAHLKTLTADAIIATLKTGAMAPMAAGLTDANFADIAAFLTAGAAAATPPAEAKPADATPTTEQKPAETPPQ
jgi:polyvinyl alcohol dehydrogenase (cytochrome)